MTAQELQKRNERAQKLRVIQVDEQSFYVESSEGKICYRVVLSDDDVYCTCGDFARNVKTDSNFRCKHIMAVNSCIPEGDVETAQFLDKKKPKLDERFITEIEGNEFVKYPGLLDLGHQKGILKIEVESLQLPTKENGNFAVCKATVVSKTGETFTDLGDANPGNCTSRVSKHLLRMASTRAIARALRSYTNIGMTCLEELADLSDVIKGESSRARPKAVKRTPKKSNGGGEQTASKPNAQSQDESKDKPKETSKDESKKKDFKPESSKPEEATAPKMSEAQKRAVYNLSRRRGISVEELENMAQETYKTSLEELSATNASIFIRSLQQAA